MGPIPQDSSEATRKMFLALAHCYIVADHGRRKALDEADKQKIKCVALATKVHRLKLDVERSGIHCGECAAIANRRFEETLVSAGAEAGVNDSMGGIDFLFVPEQQEVLIDPLDVWTPDNNGVGDVPGDLDLSDFNFDLAPPS